MNATKIERIKMVYTKKKVLHETLEELISERKELIGEIVQASVLDVCDYLHPLRKRLRKINEEIKKREKIS